MNFRPTEFKLGFSIFLMLLAFLGVMYVNNCFTGDCFSHRDFTFNIVVLGFGGFIAGYFLISVFQR